MRKFLTVGGYANLVIACLHIVGLCWAKDMFRITGISRDMEHMADIHSSLPYVITIFAAIIFALFGIYGLSIARGRSKLPYPKVIVFSIAAIYILRGCMQIVLFRYEDALNTPMPVELLYSSIALLIGIAYAIGGKAAFSS